MKVIRRRSCAMSVVGVLALAACSGGGDDTAASEPAEEPAEEPSREPSGATAEGAADQADVGFDIGMIGRDVIVEMRVVLSSDDIARTVASIRAAASNLGGGVASAEVDFGDPSTDEPTGFAVLVVKVPPEQAERLLAGLDDTATIESVNQSAQDVTEQLVDLDVRIANARQSVANVRGFMDRATNLSELVTLEGELTRRQTELERLEAQQRNLSDRVALSTITIEVVPADSVAEAASDDGIGDALRGGWSAFVGFFFVIALVLAAMLPFVVAGLVIAAMGWSARRWFRRPGATPTDGGSSAPARTPSDVSDELVGTSHDD